MSGVKVREMIPARGERWPVWELSLDGEVIGWVSERHVRGAVNAFYRAVGIHRATGRKIDLELSTDRADRIEAVRRFWLDPMSAPQHLPFELRA